MISSQMDQDVFLLNVWKPVLATFYFAILATFKFGTPLLAQKYSIYSIELHHLTSLMSTMATIHILILILYFISLYSAKHDLIFGYCLMLMTTVGSILAANGISANNHLETNPTETEAIRLARDHIQLHEKIPYWLHHTQISRRCCGIYGFKDYRAFLYHGNHEKFKDDVPISCCHSATQARQNKCYSITKNTSLLLLPNDNDNAQDTEGINTIFVRNEGSEWTNSLDKLHPSDEIIHKLYPNMSDDTVEKFKSPISDLFEVDQGKVGNYLEKGCFSGLLDQSQNLQLAYMTFLLSTSVISWILVIQFVNKNKKYFFRCLVNQPKSKFQRSKALCRKRALKESMELLKRRQRSNR